MAFNWKSLDNDDIIIDRDSSKFKLEMKRWKDECSFVLDIPVLTADAIQPISEKQLKYSNPLFDVVFDKKDPSGIESEPNCELGGLEFIIILKQKPASNSWVFPINTKNLQFWYQPELTQEEKDAGFTRPENVVGSYAVYKIDRKTEYTDEAEAQKYKVGKVFHIYRPKVWDSSINRKETWGDLNISGNVLSISVDQKFLNQAKYPVYIDPTFGYETAGASGYSIDDNITGDAFLNSAGAGNGDSITAYITRSSSITSHRAKCAIYDNASPANYIQTTAEKSDVPQDANWNTFNFGTQPSISDATTYFLCIWGSIDAGSGNFKIHYDSAASAGRINVSSAYNGWASTLTTGTGAFNFSLYCTFESGGLTISPSGIASLEAFGSQQLNLRLLASAIASGEAIGTLKINHAIQPSGIASLEGFGTAKLNLKLILSGIGSAEAFGSHIVSLGGQFIYPSSITSEEAFGTQILNLKIFPSAISSEEAFGSPLIILNIIPSGIESGEVFGTAQLNLKLLLQAIESGEVFGDLTLLWDQFIQPSGIASEEAFGTVIIGFTGIVYSIESEGRLELKLNLTAFTEKELDLKAKTEEKHNIEGKVN